MGGLGWAEAQAKKKKTQLTCHVAILGQICGQTQCHFCDILSIEAVGKWIRDYDRGNRISL